jgi:light-regulated signal transduction histidine kinase (bacteriophytochrome)
MERADYEELVYAAAHDLKEPLRTVRNFAQLLARTTKGKLDADSEQYLGFILHGTARMQALVDGMLALSQAGDGPRMRRVSSGEIVADCIRALDAAISESGATIVCGEMPDVSGDPGQLTQLFQNLLANSIKYRRNGVAPDIRISAAPEGGMWKFRVADNGQGFDPAQAEAVFTPFRRLHGKGVSGSGIGLAICRKIVAAHGGAIGAEPVPGEGCTFWFTLPADLSLTLVDH